MSDLFQIGEEASCGKLLDQLGAIRTQGENVLAQVESKRLATLVEFERRLSAMNGRRQQSNRVMAPRVAARFVVSDFLGVDQAQTTATVRADAQAVTLRERETPSDAALRSKRFSVSGGTAEAMDATNSLYRAYTDDGTIPTGTFELELVTPLSLTLLVFDLAAMPSEPTVAVEVSTTGTTWVPAKQVSLNGYRLNAWLEAMTVRFVRVILTPSHPDTLGSRSYTFGLTAFNGTTVEFHLLSELVSRPLSFRPHTQQVRLNATVDPGLTYFLAFNGGGFVEVPPGQAIDVPGVTQVTATDVQELDQAPGVLDHAFTAFAPAIAYPETLRAHLGGHLTDSIRIAPGMQASARDTRLMQKYIGVNATQLRFICVNASSSDPYGPYPNWSFNLEYLTGPAAVSVQLKVQLHTTDRAVTPVFRGAVLEEV
jgi:hypothetical protein